MGHVRALGVIRPLTVAAVTEPPLPGKHCRLASPVTVQGDIKQSWAFPVSYGFQSALMDALMPDLPSILRAEAGLVIPVLPGKFGDLPRSQP